APVRDIDPELQRLLPRGPGDRVDEREVVLGTKLVVLRAAADKAVLYDDARLGVYAGAWLVLVAIENLDFVKQRRRDGGLVTVAHLVFSRGVIEACLGERDPADALVRVLLVEVREADRAGVARAELVGHGAGRQDVAKRRRDVGLHRATGRLRIDDGLVVLRVERAREQEAGALAVTNRPAEGSFDDTPLLRRFLGGKRVARGEGRIAEPQVDGPRIGLPARLRDDVDAAASRPHVLGRIRILIDLDLLNGRRRKREHVHLDAVDEDGRSVRAER